jgi:hypothetical protein
MVKIDVLGIVIIGDSEGVDTEWDLGEGELFIGRTIGC